MVKQPVHSTSHNGQKKVKEDIVILGIYVWAAQRTVHPCHVELWALQRYQGDSRPSTYSLSYTPCQKQYIRVINISLHKFWGKKFPHK